MPNLPIGLPPSPLPRNAIPSPAPNENTPQLQQQQVTPIYLPKTPEPFAAQFNAVFPPTIPEPISNVPNVPPPPIGEQVVIAGATTTLISSDDKSNLDSLFQSTFPDPFREMIKDGGVSGSGMISNSSSGEKFAHNSLDMLQQQHGSLPPMDASGGIINFVPTQLAGTPTKNAQLLITQKIGHRRNMSDTTAFNK